MICFGPAIYVPNMPVSELNREPSGNQRVTATAYALRLLVPALVLILGSLA